MPTSQLDQATSGLSADEVLGKVQILLKELLGLETTESIVANARLAEDLGFDSLAMVDLIIAFEEGFGLRMHSASSVDLFGSVRTVQDAADLVVQLLQQRDEAPPC